MTREEAIALARKHQRTANGECVPADGEGGVFISMWVIDAILEAAPPCAPLTDAQIAEAYERHAGAATPMELFEAGVRLGEAGHV